MRLGAGDWVRDILGNFLSVTDAERTNCVAPAAKTLAFDCPHVTCFQMPAGRVSGD